MYEQHVQHLNLFQGAPGAWQGSCELAVADVQLTQLQQRHRAHRGSTDLKPDRDSDEQWPAMAHFPSQTVMA